MVRILITEDDISFAELLEGYLQEKSFSISLAHTIAEGRKALLGSHFDLVLLDYRLPDGTGMELLNTIREQNLQVPAIIMTSFNDVRTAVTMIRLGAYDYITKPVNPDELLLAVNKALAKRGQVVKQVPAEVPKFIEGKSDVSRMLYEHIKLVAPTDFSVILQGESGTGKEQVAAGIHGLSKRKNAPFIALDCGALSAELANSELFGHVKGAFTGAVQDKKGQFEQANGGTLFLDEVGNLSYEVQVKLLRALQEHEINPVGSNERIKTDVRIITATNDDLLSSVKSGKFREDLYHRLNEFKIQLPSLQERKEDLDLFIDHFIEQANSELGKKVKGITEGVRHLFMKYDWPGNLRELKNILKRAVLLTTENKIGVDNLPEEMLYAISEPKFAVSKNLRNTKEDSEKELIIKTLVQVKYNKSKAARMLDIDRSTLYYKMSKYGIEG